MFYSYATIKSHNHERTQMLGLNLATLLLTMRPQANHLNVLCFIFLTINRDNNDIHLICLFMRIKISIVRAIVRTMPYSSNIMVLSTRKTERYLLISWLALVRHEARGLGWNLYLQSSNSYCHSGMRK